MKMQLDWIKNCLKQTHGIEDNAYEFNSSCISSIKQ